MSTWIVTSRIVAHPQDRNAFHRARLRRGVLLGRLVGSRRAAACAFATAQPDALQRERERVGERGLGDHVAELDAEVHDRLRDLRADAADDASAPISRAAVTVFSRCCAVSVSTVGTPVMSMIAICGAGLDDALQQRSPSRPACGALSSVPIIGSARTPSQSLTTGVDSSSSSCCCRGDHLLAASAGTPRWCTGRAHRARGSAP